MQYQKIFQVCIQASIVFLKLNRILTKIDISCVKSQDESAGPNHPLVQFDANCGKIQYVNECPLNTDRPSFFLILKLSQALDDLFNVLPRLHGRKHKCAFC